MTSEIITELPIENVLSVSALDRISVLSISDLQSVDDNKNTSTYTSCSSPLCTSSSLKSSRTSSSSSSSPGVEAAHSEGKKNEGKKALETSLLPHHKLDVYSGSSALSPSRLPVSSKQENAQVELMNRKNKEKSNDTSRTPQSLSFSLSPAPPPRLRILNPYDGVSEASKSGFDQNERGATMMAMSKRGGEEGLRGDRREKPSLSSSTSSPPVGNLFRRQSFNGRAGLFFNYQSAPAVLTAHSDSMNLVSRAPQQKFPPSSSASQPSVFPSLLTAGNLQLIPAHVGFSGQASRLKVTARNRFSAGISRQVQSTRIQSVRSLPGDDDDHKKSEINSLSEFNPSSPPSTQAHLSDWRRVTANPIVRARWARLIQKVVMKAQPFSSAKELSSSSPPPPSQSLSPSPPSSDREDSFPPPASLPHTMAGEKLRSPSSILKRFCTGCPPPQGTPDALGKQHQHIRAKLLNSNPSDGKNQSYLLIEVGSNKEEERLSERERERKKA